MNEYSYLYDCFLKVTHDFILYLPSLTCPLWQMRLPFPLGVGLLFLSPQEFWSYKTLACCVLSLAPFPFYSISLQTGIHTKLSVCFIVNQTVLTSSKIYSFFIIPYWLFKISFTQISTHGCTHIRRTEQVLRYQTHATWDVLLSLLHFTFVKCWSLSTELILQPTKAP